MAEIDKRSESSLQIGGCEGPEAMYVKLIANDGHEFIIKREFALTSGTIKAMLSGPGETLTGHFEYHPMIVDRLQLKEH